MTTQATTLSSRTRATALVSTAILLASACGGGASEVAVDPGTLTPSTTVLDSTTTPPAPVATTAPTDDDPSAATAAPEQPSDTTVPTEPTAVGESPAAADSWTNVTGNLSEIESDCGNLTTLASAPGSDTVIAGVALQGLWTLDSPGNDWQRLGTGAGSDVITNRAAAIRFDPEEPDAFWTSGTYSGIGVFSTEDAGMTFDALGDLQHVDVVGVDMSDPEHQTLLAGVHEQPDLRLSTDGGETWRSLAQSLPPGIGRSNSPHVLDSSTFLVGTWLTDQPGIYRSTDQGLTWTHVFEGFVLELGIPFTLPDGSLLWVLHNGSGVIRSTDDGATWEPWSFTPLVVSIQDMGDGRLASATDNQVMISEDDGVTWTWVGPPAPFKPWSFAYAAGQRTFYISQWDCEPRVRPDAVAALSLLPD